MARQRIYTTAAERQRAYRARLETPPTPHSITPDAPAAQYRTWQTRRDTLSTELARLAEEIRDYAQERSDAWQESDRAATLHTAQETLDDLADQLAGIDI